MANLKPCPWCAAGEFDFRENKHWTGMRDRLLSVDLVHWCDPRGVLPRCTITLTAKTAAEAVEAWNRWLSPSPGEGRPLDAEEPEESPKISRAPWTDAEVENLRRRQAARWLHPYTGPGHVNLIPSNEGWRLPPDGEIIYQQWAWRSDVEGDIGTDPLERLRVASPGEGQPEATP